MRSEHEIRKLLLRKCTEQINIPEELLGWPRDLQVDARSTHTEARDHARDPGSGTMFPR